MRGPWFKRPPTMTRAYGASHWASLHSTRDPSWKAAALTDLTLIGNGVFVEAVVRVLQKSLTPEEFMAWITTPVVSELERLPGDVTYSK